MKTWIAAVGGVLFGLAPLVADTPDTAATPDQTPGCTRVGIHIKTDDLNATRLVCNGVTPATSDAVETTSAPPTEAPTQFFPLGDQDQ